MKNTGIRRLPLVIILAGIMSCGGDSGSGPPSDAPRATSITISQGSLSLTFLNQTVVLTATVLDQFGRTFNAVVTWSSDNPSVVTVDAAGQVTSTGNGAATVTATSGSLTASASVNVLQVATRVSIVLGDDQTGTVAQALSDALVIRSEDQGGSPMPGVSVTFTAAAGSGTVAEATVTTDGDAQASTTWTLGSASGTQQVVAAILDASAGFATFSATAQAGPATTLTKTSGDAQAGSIGLTLDAPLIVTLVDDFGNGVGGASVDFAVTGGGGSISPSEVTTAGDGTAQANWTLGPIVGTNNLSASADGLPAVPFTATAGAAMPDLVPGVVVTTPTNPTTTASFQVSTTVANVGNASAAAGVQVLLLIDGADGGTIALPGIAAGESSEATYTVGPLSAGSHVLRAVVDPGGTLAELDEGNNTIQRSTSVTSASMMTAGSAIGGLSGTTNSERLFTLVIPPGAPANLVVSLSEGTGDADLYVHPGDRPADRDDYQCRSGSPVTTESCVINGAQPGTYSILLFAFSDFSGARLVATTDGAPVPFDIELVFLSSGTAAQNAAVEEAAARWMSVVTSDTRDVDFSTNPIPADACTAGQPLINGVIDDLRIFVMIQDIDGRGGTLASAGPCRLRGLSEHPSIGVMRFDENDLEPLENSGGLLSVILHEMGHVLGIGTIWNNLGLLRNPSLPSNQGADTHFLGSRARAAFDVVGGNSTYTLGQKVPVENLAGQGSGDSHWRESVLVQELMTPSHNGGQPNPMSLISIESLADLGYVVDVSQAEPFFRSFNAPARSTAAGPIIDLRGDVRTGPIFRIDTSGQVKRVIQR